MIRKASAFILAAGIAAGSFATDARVAVMGRQTTPWFYRDEVTVFNNPADMSLYPNLIYGSFGWVGPDETSANFAYENFQPKDPLFGAMISHRFTEEDNGPMFSIGAFVNRTDPMLRKLMNEGEKFGSNLVTDRDFNLVDPVGKLDLMVGYDLGNGVAIGAGLYSAFQAVKKNGDIIDQTEFYKGSLGLNWNIEQGLDLEGAVNFGFTTAKFTPTSGTSGELYEQQVVVSDNEYFLRGDVRFFSAVPAINGSFVPQVSLEYLKLNNNDIIDLNGGVGINMNIDRGFFWAGLQGVYTQENNNADNPSSIGARISFGIERNIVWDWFLIRVGGQKEIRYNTNSDGNTTEWSENASSNGLEDDLVGLGFGVNIDNRLRVDFVVSEDLPYTLTNLVSGAQHHLFSRVSATYRF